MFNRSESNRGARGLQSVAASSARRLRLGAFAALAVMLALPSLCQFAQAGVDVEEGRSAFDIAPTANAASAPASGRYQLRCWQHGRLVLEESGLDIRPDGVSTAAPHPLAGSVKLTAADSSRQPLYLTETQNATCLLRPLRADPSPRR